ncbi:hypothetical protein PAMP_021462 [Pampus punctatissimus]
MGKRVVDVSGQKTTDQQEERRVFCEAGGGGREGGGQGGREVNGEDYDLEFPRSSVLKFSQFCLVFLNTYTDTTPVIPTQGKLHPVSVVSTSLGLVFVSDFLHLPGKKEKVSFS